jgi:hypothetical protein
MWREEDAPTYDLLWSLTASASPWSSSEAASTEPASTPGTRLATFGRSWRLRCEPMPRSDPADSCRCDPQEAYRLGLLAAIVVQPDTG